MMGYKLRLALAAASLGLAACSGPRGPFVDVLLSSGGTNTAGSHQMFDEASYERIDLVTLLDPENRRAALPRPATVSTSTAAGQDPHPSALAVEVERAFRAFYTYASDSEERRSRVQDRVLAASEQRCNTYKHYLKRVETGQSTATGILATVLGGAGAIVTGTSAARGLAGLAGISSGVGAELKQGYFANVASHVVVPGIDLARAEIRRDMMAKRGMPIATYTVEAALVDASRYHAACSINAGLERAGQAVREINNPGIRQFSLTLGQVSLAQKMVRRLGDDKVEITEQDLRNADGGFIPASSRVPSASESSALAGGVERLMHALNDRAMAMKSAEDTARQKAEAIAAQLKAQGVADAAMQPANCALLQTDALKAECHQRAALLAITASTPTTTTPTFASVTAVLTRVPPQAYLDGLSKADANVRAAAYKLDRATAGSVEHIKLTQELKNARSQQELAYGKGAVHLALLDQGIGALRKAIEEGKSTEFVTHLKQMHQAATDLAGLGP